MIVRMKLHVPALVLCACNLRGVGKPGVGYAYLTVCVYTYIYMCSN